MCTLRHTGLVMALALTAAARLAGQPGTPPSGRAYLFTLDLAGTPLDEFPSAVKALNGTMTVVDKNGQHMLRASSPSELLISLPQALPPDFTVEVDLIPKSCCNPEDFMLEGTPARNRGVASAELSWTPRSLMVVGGGPVYQADMPADLAASTPGNPTQIVITFSGTTVKLYTNGRRMYTLDKQFARGRVLRVWLGGQDEGLNAVYLAGLQIVSGAVPPTVIAANPSPPPGRPQPPSNPTPPPGQPQPPPPAPAPAPVTAVLAAPPTGTITPVTAPPPSPPATGPAPGGPGNRPAATPLPPPPASKGPLTPPLVGTGISDITGPIAEVGMMGYGDFGQQTAGLHMRLFARAFIFASPTTGKRIVWVNTELGMLFSSVKQGVLKKLAAKYGAQYDDRNVMISATHTHSGPGGFSHHVMYNLTTFGHIAQNYTAIVDGITEAIDSAHAHVATGSVSLMAGLVAESTMVNRSLAAYVRNPEACASAAFLPPITPLPPCPQSAAKSASLPIIDQEMDVLNIQSGGRPIGAIAWHAVHNTSMPNTNHLVSSDHKGYAALLLERRYGSIPPLQNYGRFVAAFPNGAEGDMSPNIVSAPPVPAGPVLVGPGRDPFESTYIIGQREYAAAYSLFTNPGQTQLAGDVDYRHMFVIMPGFPVTLTTHTNGEGRNFLCPAGYGASFNAGAEDGRSGPATEGLALGSTVDQVGLDAFRVALVATVSVLMPPLGPVVGGAMLTSADKCQLPKPVLIPTGSLTNWTPVILPFQLFRMGSLVIAGLPCEMTMQAGRRLRDSLMVTLAPLGVQKVILTGLANEYSGYVATPEEYDSQQYEGASTLYGRLTFDAYQQIFRQLAKAMVAGQPVVGVPRADDLGLIPQMELQYGVSQDEVPAGETFGQVLVQPPLVVARGSEVHSNYRSGHPKNDLRRNNTYVRIERDAGGGNWTLVAWDAMPETRLYWMKEKSICPNADRCFWSQMEVVWNIPLDATPGTYRIRFVGSWMNGVTNQPERYQGMTRTFTVQ